MRRTRLIVTFLIMSATCGLGVLRMSAQTVELEPIPADEAASVQVELTPIQPNAPQPAAPSAPTQVPIATSTPRLLPQLYRWGPPAANNQKPGTIQFPGELTPVSAPSAPPPQPAPMTPAPMPSAPLSTMAAPVPVIETPPVATPAAPLPLVQTSRNNDVQPVVPIPDDNLTPPPPPPRGHAEPGETITIPGDESGPPVIPPGSGAEESSAHEESEVAPLPAGPVTAPLDPPPQPSGPVPDAPAPTPEVSRPAPRPPVAGPREVTPETPPARDTRPAPRVPVNIEAAPTPAPAPMPAPASRSDAPVGMIIPGRPGQNSGPQGPQPIADSTRPGAVSAEMAPASEPVQRRSESPITPAPQSRFDSAPPPVQPPQVQPPAPQSDANGQAPAKVAGGQPLILEKIGPATVNRGSALVYQLLTRNITNAPLVDVRVEDDLPPGVQFVRAEPQPEVRGSHLSWKLGVLEPGAERRCQVELMPTGPGEYYACASATFTTSACLRSAFTQPKLMLRKTGPATALVGDPIPFQIQVSNVGDGPALGVVVHDHLPTGITHPQGPHIEAAVGTLAPGETRLITLDTTAGQTGTHVNQAEAVATNAARVTAEAAVTITAPALVLRKDGPPLRYIGREAEFDLEVMNPGTAPATHVQLLDRLPPDLEFLSASDGGNYDANSRVVTWNLDNLEPGQRRGVHLKAVGKVSGTFINEAIARGDHNLEARSQTTLRVEGVAGLMLEVVDLDDPIEIGNETVFEVHVVNQGTGPTTKLQIVAIAPEGMTPRSGDGPTAARIQGQQVIFEPLDTLAGKADVTYRIRVLCKKVGDWRFRVEMTSDHLGTPVIEEESTRIYQD